MIREEAKATAKSTTCSTIGFPATSNITFAFAEFFMRVPFPAAIITVAKLLSIHSPDCYQSIVDESCRSEAERENRNLAVKRMEQHLLDDKLFLPRSLLNL